MPKLNKARGKELLQNALEGIPELRRMSNGSPEFKKWQRDTRVALENIFEDKQDRVDEFNRIRYSPAGFILGGDDTGSFQRAYVRGLDSASALIKSMIGEIEDYQDYDDGGLESPETQEVTEATNTRQVFVIHGREHGTRAIVTEFLGDLEIEAVVLQEQPDEGKTIIEKFEKYAQVNFALALLTPDDIGGLAEDDLQPRARQNVIFEFGYFVGRYGRHRVRALVKGNPEIPSDYSGVIYIPLDDAGAWKGRLITEMRSAGFEIDANLVF